MKRDFVNLYSKDLSSKKWPSDINFLIAFWGSLILITVFTIYYGIAIGNYFKESNKNKRLSAELNLLSLKDKELINFSFKLKELNIRSKAIKETVHSLDSLFQQKIYWSKFLKLFSNYLNDNVWLNSLNVDFMDNQGKYLYVQIQGGAISLKDLNQFLEKIEKNNGNVKVSFKVIDNKGVLFYSFGINFVIDTKRLK